MCIFSLHHVIEIYVFVVFTGDRGPFRESQRPGVAGPPKPHPPAEGKPLSSGYSCLHIQDRELKLFLYFFFVVVEVVLVEV